MANQPPGQEQRRQQEEQRSRSSDPPARSETQSQTQRAYDVPVLPDAVEQAASGKKSGFKVGEAKVTAGKTGEHNLTVEMIDVWIGNSKPVRFNVRTAPGNALEVHLEQLSYRKAYNGTGTVQTQVIPIVPIGTNGKIVAQDTTTGEVLEQPWTWVNMGGGGGLGLWEAIKRLIWKPAK